MGAAESAEAGSDQQLAADDPKLGYHVLRVKPVSPSAEAGLEAYFDYIIAVQGVRLDAESSFFMDTLQNNLNKEVKMVLFNSKRQDFREVSLVPNTSWGGDGLVGCSIRFCSFEHAAENVWHVLDVYSGSPAADAGLVQFHDYIIGSPDAIMKEQGDLFALVEQCVSTPVRLFVYNWQTDRCREVTIIPNPKWGGEGILGCDIGFGFLHRIPSTPFTKPPATNTASTTTVSEVPGGAPAAISFSTLRPPGKDASPIVTQPTASNSTQPKVSAPMMVPSSSVSSLPSMSASVLPGLGQSQVDVVLSESKGSTSRLPTMEERPSSDFTAVKLVAP